MTNKVYELNTLNDFLKVPPERLEDCLRGVLYSLEMHWLAHGEDAPNQPIQVLQWIDDGDLSVDYRDAGGQTIFKLKVTHADP